MALKCMENAKKNNYWEYLNAWHQLMRPKESNQEGSEEKHGEIKI